MWLPEGCVYLYSSDRCVTSQVIRAAGDFFLFSHYDLCVSSRVFFFMFIDPTECMVNSDFIEVGEVRECSGGGMKGVAVSGGV